MIRDAVRGRLAGEESWSTYRIELAWAGEDPRVALRESAELTDDDVASIDARRPVGYELSPRGTAYLDRTRGRAAD